MSKESLLTGNPEILEVSPEMANIPAEQAMLGMLFLDNHALLHTPHLRSDHFYEPVHQRLFSAMARAFERGNSFSPITLKLEFDQDQALTDIGGSLYLMKLAMAGNGLISPKIMADMLVDLAQRRSILKVCDAARHAILMTSAGSAVDAATSLSQQIDLAVSDSTGTMFEDDYEVTETIISDLKRDVQPYPTGYGMLDLAMDGGLYPGKSYGFAARKKVGKTILGGSISCNLNVAGVRHLFICGEMSPAEIQKRTLARLLSVQQSVFNSRAGRTSRFLRMVADEAQKSQRAVIYKNAPGLTFEDLKYYVLLARKKKKITGFILDYWQLVGGKPKGKSTAEHLDDVAQWIADTCRKTDLWSITMAQINQEGNTRGGEGIRLAFDQVYTLKAPSDDAGRRERWLDMSDTRYTAWRSVGSSNRPAFFLNENGPYFAEKAEMDDGQSDLVAGL